MIRGNVSVDDDVQDTCCRAMPTATVEAASTDIIGATCLNLVCRLSLFSKSHFGCGTAGEAWRIKRCHRFLFPMKLVGRLKRFASQFAYV